MPSATRRVPGTQEVVLDTIAEDDVGMPEEFRGCRVVEQTLPGGKVQVFYRGADGFAVAEEQAEFLIEAYREELASITPKVPQPQLRGGYAAPAAVGPVEPRLMGGGGAVPTVAPLTEEVIDELGFGDDLPPELRGAAFVRRGGEFRYVTRDGTRLSKDMAEGMMERWDRDRLSRVAPRVPAPAPVSAVPTLPWGVPGAGAPAPVSTPTLQGPAVVPGIPAPMTAAVPGLGSGPAVSPAVPTAPLPQAATRSPAPAPAAEPEGAPAAEPEGAPEPEAERSPAVAISAPEPEPEVAPAPAPMAAAVPLSDPTLETALDMPAVAAARHAAERVRSRVLDDGDAVYRIDVRVERLQQACHSEIERKRTKHRFENLIQLSAAARETLTKAWADSRDRAQKEAARDLDQDMLVLGLFNPMTLRDIDLGEFLTIARLRHSDRRRDIVTGELARRVQEEVPAALHQYLMTRAFVDRVADTAAASGSAEEALRAVMEERLAEALEAVVTEVMRRHGIWLPDLQERLRQRLRPLIEGLCSLAG